MNIYCYIKDYLADEETGDSIKMLKLKQGLKEDEIEERRRLEKARATSIVSKRDNYSRIK